MTREMSREIVVLFWLALLFLAFLDLTGRVFR
jgi:hypothetical protein